MDPEKTEGSDWNRPPGSHRTASRRPEGQEAVPVIGPQDAHVGVQKVEAALRIYGRYARWCLFVGYGHFLVVLLASSDGLLTGFRVV